jgi:MarR family transcriptional regulator, negative regulator of the multidrug operon emrRAB
MDTRSTKSGPADGLDFWSFLEVAKVRLADHGFRDLLPTEVIFTLLSVANTVIYDFEAALHRPRGRNWSAFTLLFAVWCLGPLEPKTVATLTGLSRAAVSSLTKALVVDGAMVRTANERDGRSVLLSVTAKGSDEVLQTFREQSERERGWMSGLTAVEQQTLVALLRKLVRGHSLSTIRERA